MKEVGETMTGAIAGGIRDPGALTYVTGNSLAFTPHILITFSCRDDTATGIETGIATGMAIDAGTGP